MNKLVIIGFSACALAASTLSAAAGDAPYQMMRMGVNVDYSTIAMAQVNKLLNTGSNVTAFGSGISTMLDLDVALAPFVMIGARGGYLFCQSASASYNYVLYNQKTTVDASLIPLEVGLSVNLAPPATPITIMAGVFGGYGFAFASIKNEFSALGQTASVTQPYTGGGFIGDLVATISFKLASALSFDINAGYRLAKIAQMTQSQDVSWNGIPGVSIPVGAKGDVLKDSDNSDLAFDYSGLNVGVGLSLAF